jgi:hypothetical protein
MRTHDELLHAHVRQERAQAADDAMLNGILRQEHADRQVLGRHWQPHQDVCRPTALDQRVIHPAAGLLVNAPRSLAFVDGHVVVQPGERTGGHAVSDEHDRNAEPSRHEVERDAAGIAVTRHDGELNGSSGQELRVSFVISEQLHDAQCAKHAVAHTVHLQPSADEVPTGER